MELKEKSKTLEFIVKETDYADFEGEVVHEVYSTFSIARDAEWTGRQVLLDLISDEEEGVGTDLEIKHKGPAFLGETVRITAIPVLFEHGRLKCTFEARVGDRLIAVGTTGQRVLKKAKLNKLFRKG